MNTVIEYLVKVQAVKYTGYLKNSVFALIFNIILHIWIIEKTIKDYCPGLLFTQTKVKVLHLFKQPQSGQNSPKLNVKGGKELNCLVCSRMHPYPGNLCPVPQWIQTRFWCHYSSTPRFCWFVSPIAVRTQGQLLKQGSLYSPPKRSTPNFILDKSE